MNNGLVEIARFYDSGEAHIVKGALQSQDINCELFDEHTNSLWLYQFAIGGLRLMVATEDKTRAQEILAQFKSTNTRRAKRLLPDRPVGWFTLFFYFLIPLALTAVLIFIDLKAYELAR